MQGFVWLALLSVLSSSMLEHSQSPVLLCWNNSSAAVQVAVVCTLTQSIPRYVF